MITDTHAHLFWDSFKEDFNGVIKRALENKVTTIINVGTDLETSRKALDQAQGKLADIQGLSVYSSIGIHPHDAIKYASKQGTVDRVQLEKDIETLKSIYKSNPARVIAVGECGLDFNFNNRDFVPSSLRSSTEEGKVLQESDTINSNRESSRSLSIEEIKNLQRLLLKAQVNLAKKLNLSLLIHTREAWDEIFEFISDHFGILHCFSGDLEILKKALTSNFLISFPGTITYPKNDSLRKVVKQTPLERIVFETDCPFLPPQSKRGKRNEPSNIVETLKLAADLKELSFEKIAKISTENAKKVLKI